MKKLVPVAMISRRTVTKFLTACLVTLAAVGLATGCSHSTQGSAPEPQSVGLTADSSCRTYLTADKAEQDDAVKKIAVAQNDSIVLTPQGRPRVDYYCGSDDGLTLGGAIAHAGAELTSSHSKAAAAGPGSHTGAPAPTRTVTTTARPDVTVPPRPASGPGLRAAFDSAIAVDPEPFMGAYPNVYFASPSQNIGCYVFLDEGNRVECTISSYEFDQPGPDCPLGAVVSIAADDFASAPTCSPVPLYPDQADVLEYGQSITNGSMACVSASVGISCLDLDTDRGFTLSKQQYLPVN